MFIRTDNILAYAQDRLGANMKELFLISGLGADKRVFNFLNLSLYIVHYIEWIDPGTHESIEEYAKKISMQIDIEKPILVGISFGGMIAVEIGKQIETEKIILISSARSKKDLPPNFLARKLKLHTLIPARILKKSNAILFWFFSVKSKTEKKLLRSIIKDTDEKFLKWAIDKIVTWENEIELNNIVRIHGTSDRLIPFTTADYTIEDGGHLMIMNRATEIDKIIKDVIFGVKDDNTSSQHYFVQ